MKRTIWEVVSGAGVETRRTDREVAENDARILRWLGKHGVRVEEVQRDA